MFPTFQFFFKSFKFNYTFFKLIFIIITVKLKQVEVRSRNSKCFVAESGHISSPDLLAEVISWIVAASRISSPGRVQRFILCFFTNVIFHFRITSS